MNQALGRRALRSKLHSISCASLKLFFISIGSAGMSLPACADFFANQFVQFKMPPEWICNLEGAEWVCQNRDHAKKKDAIIVLAAKLKGNQDSLDQYLKYLEKPKTYNSVAGRPVKSSTKWAKHKEINDHPWVDALHLESEIPGFYTRYLATVKNDIAVLVTYSINQKKYQLYLSEFEELVKTLKVFRKPGGLNSGSRETDIFSTVKIPDRINSNSIFGANQGGDKKDTQTTAPKKKGTPISASDWLVLIGGIGAIAVILIRIKRKQG